jgi:predicted metal-dependent hydrolase
MPQDFTPDDAWRAALARDCDCELPEVARAAIAKFNAGEYYEQHDLLEALWMETESPVRQLYQAILQVGIAYYQIEQGNRRGAIKMLSRALRWIDYLPGRCQGVDVAQLRANAEALRAILLETGEDGLASLDRALLRPVPIK